MSGSTTLSIRLPADIKAKLERLGEVTQRSNSYLAADAIGQYVTRELEIVEGILDGIADIEAGRVILHDQVVADMKARYGLNARSAAE